MNVMEKHSWNLIPSLILLGCAFFLVPQVTLGAVGDGWLRDYDKALVQAKAENKKILILFASSNLPVPLSIPALESQEFKDYAKQNMVLFFADLGTTTPAQLFAYFKLQEQFKIKVMPAILFLDSGGNEILQDVDGKKVSTRFESDTLIPQNPKTFLNVVHQKFGEPIVDTNEGWLRDYDKAVEQSQKENKKLLILFTGSDWCSWSIKFESEVQQKQEFKDYAKKNLVLLYVNFPRLLTETAAMKAYEEKLQDQFKPNGYPTIIMLSPSGTELFRVSGYIEEGLPGYMKEFEAATLVDDLMAAAAAPPDYQQIKLLLTGGMEKCEKTELILHYLYLAHDILKDVDESKVRRALSDKRQPHPATFPMTQENIKALTEELKSLRDHLPILSSDQAAEEAQWSRSATKTTLIFPAATSVPPPASDDTATTSNTPVAQPTPVSDIKVFTLKSGKKIIGTIDQTQIMEGITFVNVSINGEPPRIKTISEDQIASVTDATPATLNPAPEAPAGK